MIHDLAFTTKPFLIPCLMSLSLIIFQNIKKKGKSNTIPRLFNCLIAFSICLESVYREAIEGKQRWKKSSGIENNYDYFVVKSIPVTCPVYCLVFLAPNCSTHSIQWLTIDWFSHPSFVFNNFIHITYLSIS